MTPKELARWRADLLSRLDALAHRARTTRQMLEAKQLHELKDREEFLEAWRRIRELFPEDFEPARQTDLKRHILFGMPHDFYDIEHHDIPAVKQSVQNYRRAGVENALHVQEAYNQDFAPFELVHPLLRDISLQHFNRREYSLAARTAVELLMDELRRLSEKSEDGAALIKSVIGTSPGQVAFSDCSNQNERTATDGLKDILLGAYKGIRNPLAHQWDGFDRIEAFQIMVMCSFLFGRLQIVEPAESALQA